MNVFLQSLVDFSCLFSLMIVSGCNVRGWYTIWDSFQFFVQKTAVIVLQNYSNQTHGYQF